MPALLVLRLEWPAGTIHGDAPIAAARGHPRLNKPAFGPSADGALTDIEGACYLFR